MICKTMTAANFRFAPAAEAQRPGLQLSTEGAVLEAGEEGVEFGELEAFLVLALQCLGV